MSTSSRLLCKNVTHHGVEKMLPVHIIQVELTFPLKHIWQKNVVVYKHNLFRRQTRIILIHLVYAVCFCLFQFTVPSELGLSNKAHIMKSFAGQRLCSFSSSRKVRGFDNWLSQNKPDVTVVSVTLEMHVAPLYADV